MAIKWLHMCTSVHVRKCAVMCVIQHITQHGNAFPSSIIAIVLWPFMLISTSRHKSPCDTQQRMMLTTTMMTIKTECLPEMFVGVWFQRVLLCARWFCDYVVRSQAGWYLVNLLTRLKCKHRLNTTDTCHHMAAPAVALYHSDDV